MGYGLDASPGLHCVVDGVRCVVCMRDIQLTQPTLEAAVMVVPMIVPVPTPAVMPVPVAVVIVAVVAMAAVGRVLVRGRLARLRLVPAHGFAPSSLWWAGWPPSACSAWKMASATSCRAC